MSRNKDYSYDITAMLVIFLVPVIERILKLNNIFCHGDRKNIEVSIIDKKETVNVNTNLFQTCEKAIGIYTTNANSFNTEIGKQECFKRLIASLKIEIEENYINKRKSALDDERQI